MQSAFKNSMHASAYTYILLWMSDQKYRSALIKRFLKSGMVFSKASCCLEAYYMPHMGYDSSNITPT